MSTRLHLSWSQVRGQLLSQMGWIARRFIEHDCLTIAGSLTFTSLLALVPVMTMVYLGLAFLPEYAALAEQVESFVFRNFVPSSSMLVQEKLNQFASRAESLTSLGLLGLAITTLMLLLSIERQFNAIWQVSMPAWRLPRLLAYAGLLIFGPALVLTALWVTTYVLSLPLLAEVDVIGVAPLVLQHLPTLCLFLILGALFKFVPNAQVSVRHAAIGGIAAAAVFKLAFALFAWVSQYLVYDAIYGALAALPAFLLWLFLVWLIVLLGAVLVCSCASQQGAQAVE
jgi:membrane protein